MNLIYKNNKDRDLELNNNHILYFIYGKNGVGKTTLADTIKYENYEKFVFGSKFINEHVYITSETGEKTTSTNSENLTNLIIIDEELVKNKKILEQLQKEKREIPKFEDRPKHVGILNSEIDSSILQIIDNEITSTQKNIIDSLYFKQIIEGIKEDCSIKSEEEFKENLNKIKNSNIYEDFIKSLEELGISKFLREIQVFNKRINTYNDYILKIKEIKSYEISEIEIENWKQEGLKLHKNVDNCLFCSAELGQHYQNMFDYYNEIAVKAFNKLKKETQEIKTNLTKIINTDIYTKSEVGLLSELQELKSLDKELEVILNELNNINNIDEDSLISNIELFFEKKNLITVYNELVKYLTIEKLPEYIELSVKNDIVTKKINYYKDLIDNQIPKIIKEEMDKINTNIKKLGLQEEILLVANNHGGNKRIKLKVNNKEISEISDGEKHKLALAIFMSKIDKINLENKIIIFDDPVVTLDIQTYFRFKEYIIELVTNKITTNTKLVILSHNIHYLYVQTSNLKSNDPDLVFYKMFEEGMVKEQNLNFVKMDDYSFYNHITNLITNEERLLLVLPLVYKLFRHNLDLVARMHGISIEHSDVSPLITELNKNGFLSIEQKNIIKNYHKKLSKIRVNTVEDKIEVYKIVELINEFNNIMKILKLPFIIELPLLKGSIDKFRKISIEEVNGEGPIELDILKKLFELIILNDRPSEGNYLAHPNNQMTKGIMAFDL